MEGKNPKKSQLKKLCSAIVNTATNLSLAGAVYFSSLTGLQLWAESKAPKINSDSELTAMLNEEKKALGCSKSIKASIDYNGGKSRSGKTAENSYFIVLNKNDADLAVLRHELYHVHAGHTEHEPTFFSYWLLGEPSAILYSAFGRRK